MEVAKKIDVLYYDLDGTGLDYFLSNTLKILGSKKKVRKLMKQFHFKEEYPNNNKNIWPKEFSATKPQGTDTK